MKVLVTRLLSKIPPTDMLVARRLLNTTLLSAFCALFSGCAGTHYNVGVSGFLDRTYTGGQAYWLQPGTKGVTDGDLEFREYASYLRTGLRKAGFTEASSLEQADLAVFLSYGVGDAREQHYSYSMPIFGQTGGGLRVLAARPSPVPGPQQRMAPFTSSRSLGW